MAETRSKKAERAGDIASKRNAQAYWAKKEAAAEALRNPKVHAFTISFDIKNFHYFLSEFEGAYDETLAKDITTYRPIFPSELNEAMGYAYLPPKPPKGHFLLTHVGEGEFNFVGGYHAESKGEESDILEHTVPDAVAYIQETIATSYVKEHGIVTLTLYTVKDNGPTHTFVMESDSNEFVLVPRENENG